MAGRTILGVGGGSNGQRWLFVGVLGLFLAPSFLVGQDSSLPLKFPDKFGSSAIPGKGGNDLQSRIRVSADFQSTPDGKQGRLNVRVSLAPGWHIYSVTQPDGGPQRTVIQLEPSEAFRIQGEFRPDRDPERSQNPYFPVPEEKHAEQVVWSAPVQFAAGAAPDSLLISGKLDGQICQENQCVPLSTLDTGFVAAFNGVLEASERAPSAANAVQPQESTPLALEQVDVRLWLQMLGLGFLGGMILNLMPCVLPVIGLKVLSFMEQSHGNRGEAFR
jgi:thiol:disulfide interchange protein